jgi:hypothetical protein
MPPKVERYRSKAWLRSVASLPCVWCWREGQTQAAHMNEGKGLSLKTDDCFTAALCVTCHHELDQGSRMDRAERREMWRVAFLETIRQMALRGLLEPKP